MMMVNLCELGDDLLVDDSFELVVDGLDVLGLDGIDSIEFIDSVL